MDEPLTPFPPGTPGAPPRQPRWRDDFPIDRPRDHYVARRDFTKFLVLISGAFTAGQFWIAAQSLWRRATGKPPIERIARVDELQIGQAVLFHYPTHDDGCLLVRLAEDEFVAYSNECTHLMCAVVPQVDQGQLHCPCHVGYFDLASGRPTAGPPRRPLPKIELKITGDSVYATGVQREAR
jgi:Rieske Fe-S protein